MVRLLYLSRVPESGWYGRSAHGTYQLSVHVGEDARSDPPPNPGRYSTQMAEAAFPTYAAPEEDALRRRINQAIDAMQQESGKGCGKGGGKGGPGGPENGGQADQAPEAMDGKAPPALECRFRTRVAISLADAGPGPAAGGPPYFRVDAWVDKPGGLFGGVTKKELFARSFVPITEPSWHKRPCTWPAVDAVGDDVAYLTCEFAFAHTPPPVRDLRLEACTSDRAAVSWLPTPPDRVAPLQGYYVEMCTAGRPPRQREMGAIVPAGRHGPMSPAPEWRRVGDYEPSAEPGALIQGLQPNTRYRLRVLAVNEAGVGAPAELEMDTAPTAPSACGQLRLAGCSGPVLAVEWDPPREDGGAEVISYRVWVRPFSVSTPEASEWLEVNRVKHVSGGGPQRAEIDTQDLDSTINRYLCGVAAVNSAGEFGPRTADNACLPFPNPCAVCAPTPQAKNNMIGDRSDVESLLMGRGSGGVARMTLMEPGKRRMSVPLYPGGQGPGDDPRAAHIMDPRLMEARSFASAAADPFQSNAGSGGGGSGMVPFESLPQPVEPVMESSPPPPDRRAHAHEPQPHERGPVPGRTPPMNVWQTTVPGDWARSESSAPQRAESFAQQRAESFAPQRAESFAQQRAESFAQQRAESFAPQRAESFAPADFHYIGSPMDPAAVQNQTSQLGNSIVGPNHSQMQAALAAHHDMQLEAEREGLERDIMERTLREKQDQLDASLARYSEVNQKLRFAPTDEALLREYVETEIEAAGFQAEVAVLTQSLADLEEALRSRGSPFASFN